MIKALKVISVLSLLLAVLFAALYVIGVNEQVKATESKELVITLQDNQAYVTYSHSDSNGHWFIDPSYSTEPVLYVYDTLMEGLTESEKYITTYVDASKWELVSLENVE